MSRTLRQHLPRFVALGDVLQSYHVSALARLAVPPPVGVHFRRMSHQTNNSATAAPAATAPAATDVPRYRFLFRGRVIGNFEWICVACGRLTRSRMRPDTYVLQCSYGQCRRVWGLGHVLHMLPATSHTPSDDYIIPSGIAEAFPEGDVGRWWKQGKLMHCVHTATGSLAIPETTSIPAPVLTPPYPRR